MIINNYIAENSGYDLEPDKVLNQESKGLKGAWDLELTKMTWYLEY